MTIIKKMSLCNPVFEILKFIFSLQVMNYVNEFRWVNDGIGQLLILSTGIITRLILNDNVITNIPKLLKYMSFLFVTIFNVRIGIYRIFIKQV